MNAVSSPLGSLLEGTSSPIYESFLNRIIMGTRTGADAKTWDRCSNCKELFGGVYDKRIRLPDIVASASQCVRCWATCEILGRITDLTSVSTTLIGSIWHDNTLEIGIIGTEDAFETAPGYKIYLVIGTFCDRSSTKPSSRNV